MKNVSITSASIAWKVIAIADTLGTQPKVIVEALNSSSVLIRDCTIYTDAILDYVDDILVTLAVTTNHMHRSRIEVLIFEILVAGVDVALKQAGLDIVASVRPNIQLQLLMVQVLTYTVVYESDTSIVTDALQLEV